MTSSVTAKGTLAASLCIAMVFAQVRPALAYLKFGFQVGDRAVTLKWARTPVRVFVSDRSVPGVSPPDLQSAITRAFATWQAVSSSTIAYEFAGFTAASPFQDDGLSTIGFMERPDLDRVLGATTFLVDGSTGELLESDIMLNSAFSWSVAPAGEAGRFDVQSIALHELGHLSGLGHSPLGETEVRAGARRVIAAEAVMFPIAFPAGNIQGRTLRADDIAGISDLYPDDQLSTLSGSISGRILEDGRGVFGAHVVAFDLNTGSLVGTITLDDQGRFAIAGLSPGPHVVRVEPLDDVDLDSVFEDSARVDLDFRVSFLDRLVVVPRGGDAGGVDVKVVAK
jgi:hypothetical protein